MKSKEYETKTNPGMEDTSLYKVRRDGKYQSIVRYSGIGPKVSVPALIGDKQIAVIGEEDSQARKYAWARQIPYEIV